MDLQKWGYFGQAQGRARIDKSNEFSENQTNSTSNPGGPFHSPLTNDLKAAHQPAVLIDVPQHNAPSEKQLTNGLDGSPARISQDVSSTVEDWRAKITDSCSIAKPFNATVTTGNDLPLMNGFDAEHRLTRTKTEGAYYVRNTGSTIPNSNFVRYAVSVYSRGRVEHRYFTFDAQGQVMPILHESKIIENADWKAAGEPEWFVVQDVAERKPLAKFVESVTASKVVNAPSGDRAHGEERTQPVPGGASDGPPAASKPRAKRQFDLSSLGLLDARWAAKNERSGVVKTQPPFEAKEGPEAHD